MKKTNYIIFRKKGSSFEYFSIHRAFDTDRLSIHASKMGKITKINNLYVVSIFLNPSNFDEIISIEGTIKDAQNAIQSEFYRRNKDIVNSEDYLELTEGFEEIFYLYNSYRNGTKIITFDEIDDFQKKIPLIKRTTEEKITMLKELFIRNMHDEYNKKSRVSSDKVEAFEDILNDKFDYRYLHRLYDNLDTIKNIVFKNKELMDYLDENFISGLFKSIAKNSKHAYISVRGNVKNFYD